MIARGIIVDRSMDRRDARDRDHRGTVFPAADWTTSAVSWGIVHGVSRMHKWTIFHSARSSTRGPLLDLRRGEDAEVSRKRAEAPRHAFDIQYVCTKRLPPRRINANARVRNLFRVVCV